MRAVLNSHFDPASVPEASDVALSFHHDLPEYAPTPLRDAPELAAELGFESLEIKDETSRMGLPAFKLVGASWALERGLERAPETRRIVTASAGNHGRAVAHLCARRGLGCRILLPARVRPERVAAIEAEGAEAVVTAGSYEEAVAQAAREADEPGTLQLPDGGDAPSAHDVIDGYATLFGEIGEQADGRPIDVLIVPVGVGALAAAAARFAAPRGIRVVAVEPESAACLAASLELGRPVRVETPGSVMAGMDCAEVSPAAWPSLLTGIGAAISIGDEAIGPEIEALASAGIEAGECSGSSIAAARALPRDELAPLRLAFGLPRRPRVVAIATEGPTGGAPSSG